MGLRGGYAGPATRLREEPIKKEGGTARDGRLIDLHVAVRVYISAVSGMSARAEQLRHGDRQAEAVVLYRIFHISEPVRHGFDTDPAPVFCFRTTLHSHALHCIV